MSRTIRKNHFHNFRHPRHRQRLLNRVSGRGEPLAIISGAWSDMQISAFAQEDYDRDYWYDQPGSEVLVVVSKRAKIKLLKFREIRAAKKLKEKNKNREVEKSENE